MEYNTKIPREISYAQCEPTSMQCEPCAPQSEIYANLENLREAITELTSQIKLLTERLHPIMAPEPPEIKGSEGHNVSCSCALSEDIIGLQCKLDKLINNVADTRLRLRI